MKIEQLNSLNKRVKRNCSNRIIEDRKRPFHLWILFQYSNDRVEPCCKWNTNKLIFLFLDILVTLRNVQPRMTEIYKIIHSHFSTHEIPIFFNVFPYTSQWNMESRDVAAWHVFPRLRKIMIVPNSMWTSTISHLTSCVRLFKKLSNFGIRQTRSLIGPNSKFFRISRPRFTNTQFSLPF